MSKIFQAFLSGLFFTFIIDFTIFLGIFLHYIKPLEIDVYYNILFADNQCFILFFLFILMSGYVITYLKNIKLTLTILGTLSFIALLTLIPSIGYNVGKTILMKKNVSFKNARHTFIGDVYYDGRKTITFYDYELKKTIVLQKKELIK
jgi:hypothetical protein